MDSEIEHIDWIVRTVFAVMLAIIFLAFLIQYIVKIRRNNRYKNPCTTTWNRGKEYYHGNSSGFKKKLTLCDSCFKNSEHMGYKWQVFTSEYNGSCDCGDGDVIKLSSFSCKLHLNSFYETPRQLIYKNSHNIKKQIKKFSMLLNTNTNNARRLAQQNKITNVHELSYTGKMIKYYFKNIQFPSNSISLTDVYAVYRSDEEYEFKQNEFLNEKRMLLWHGTLRDNLTGIFNTGLKLPLTSGMFGYGIYFADRVSKSVKNTDCGEYSGSNRNSGVLLLCEVAVGKMCELRSAQSHLTEPPNNYQSVKGLGKYEPLSDWTHKKTDIIVTLGTTRKSIDNQFNSLDYNEYIVYDTQRVLIKYFVEFERN